MQDAVRGTSDGSKHAVIGRVCAMRRSESNRHAGRRALVVDPGDCVVGGDGFARTLRDSNADSREDSRDVEDDHYDTDDIASD